MVGARVTQKLSWRTAMNLWRAAGDACKRRGGVAGASPRGAEGTRGSAVILNYPPLEHDQTEEGGLK